MKNQSKKLAAVILTTLMAASSLTGCGDGSTTTNPEGSNKVVDSDGFVYVPKYIQLKNDENMYIRDLDIKGNTLYYSVNLYNEESEESTTSLYSMDLSQDEPTAIDYMKIADNVEEGFSAYTNSLMFTEDGSVIEFRTKMPIPSDNGENMTEEDYAKMRRQSVYTMRKTDINQNVIFDVDISQSLSLDSDNSYIQYSTIDKDGNIFFSNGNSYIWVYDKDGNHIKDIPLNSSGRLGGQINGLGTTSTGIAAYLSDSSNNMMLYCYNTEKKDFSDSYDNLPKNCWNSTVNPGIDGGVLITADGAAYNYSLETQSYTEITKWMDMDLNSDYVEKCLAMENGNLAVSYRDWNNDEYSIVILKKTPASEVKQKKTLTLACMNLSQDLQRAVVNFNKQSEEYRITVKDYSADVNWSSADGEDQYNTAMTQFQNDVATGNGADMFAASDINLANLANKGVIEDLNPYLEKSQKVKKDDLISSVLNAYSINGKLCCIPSTFYVVTLAGRVSELGNKSGWTIDEMIAYADQYPDASLISNASNEYILNYCLMIDFDSYVNEETGECHFNTDEFKKVLTFAKGYPDSDKVNYEDSEPKQIRSHKALLAYTMLDEPESWQVQQMIFGEPITAIGFPSSQSSGVKARGSDGICINAASENKDVAWSFVEFMLTQSESKGFHGWGYSIRKSVYDAKMKEAMIPQYETDENGNQVLDENGNPIEISNSSYGWDNDITIDVYAVTQEEADATWKVIESVDGVFSDNSQYLEIVNEEAKPYFLGQKTVDEVADIIQSRIQTYVNESR